MGIEQFCIQHDDKAQRTTDEQPDIAVTAPWLGCDAWVTVAEYESTPHDKAARRIPR